MTNTRLDRLHDALTAPGDLELIVTPVDLAGALEQAGLVLREAADHTVDEVRDDRGQSLWNPMPVSFTVRHTACELALQMRDIAGRDSDQVLKDAEKFRAFLAGE